MVAGGRVKRVVVFTGVPAQFRIPLAFVILLFKSCSVVGGICMSPWVLVA